MGTAHLHAQGHTCVHTSSTSAGSTALPTPTPGDLEQEVMLSTKTPEATVGGLSPSKGYTLQIFALTGSGNVLLARREFVSKSLRGCMCAEEAGAEPWQPLDWEPQAWVSVLAAAREPCLYLMPVPASQEAGAPWSLDVPSRGGFVCSPRPLFPPWVVLTAPRVSLQSKI